MSIYDNIIFGGVDLEVVSISPVKNQKTIKQVVGRNVTQISIIGGRSSQWELSITGVITGTPEELVSKRNALELLDDSYGHVFVDGKHDGVYYIVPGSLSFNDNADIVHGLFRYNVTLIEV